MIFGFALGATMTSAALAQDYSQEEMALLAEIRESDLGIKREYSEDGETYTLALPDGVETTDYDFDGPFTWVYAGQATFASKPEAPEGHWSQVPDVVYTSMDIDPEGYFGVGTQQKIDKYGRRWILDAVDVDAAAAMINGYNEAVEAEFGREESIAERTGVEYPEDAGKWRYHIPNAWTAQNCDSDSSYEIQEYSYDDLDLVSGTLNERQKKIVIIWGQNGNCSGTMVDTEWVLTAAHCTASGSSEYNPSTFTVCTWENLQSGAVCYDVDENRTFGNSYNGDVEDDYAVLRIDGTTSGIGWFALSEASDGYIDNFEQYHRAFPGNTPSCGSNTISDDAQTIDDSYNGRNMYSADGTIEATPSGWIKFNISSGNGMSGGPIFYCPNGTGCEDGHYITAVESIYDLTWSGGTITDGYQGGPKARDIRDWVITNTP